MSLEHIWIDLEADLAAEGLPQVCDADWCALFLLLRVDPVLQTGVVDEANSTTALASVQEWVMDRV